MKVMRLHVYQVRSCNGKLIHTMLLKHALCLHGSHCPYVPELHVSEVLQQTHHRLYPTQTVSASAVFLLNQQVLGVFARAGSCRTVSASADFLPTQQVLGVCTRAVSCGAVSASAGPKLGHCQGRQGQDSAAGGVHRQLWSSCHYCCCTACSQVSCSASNVSLSHQRVRIVMALLCGDGVQSAESTM